jgi:glycosyltransferase involved in cell wall biosynthesis
MSRRLAPLWRLREEEIDVLPNVLRPAPALLALERPPTGSCVAFLGRLERRKGYDTLVSALPRVLTANPEARALFIGPGWPRPYASGDSLDWSRHALHAYGDRVHFTGGLPSTAVPAALAGSDLVVLPSRWENFPYACAEAMAAGRCVIGSSEGGMADMIRHGVNGYLVRPERPAELADLLDFLLRQPALRAAAGAAARATITGQLSASVLGPAQETLYRKAIGLAAARP